MIGRRRVIQIIAAAAAIRPTDAGAGTERWRGHAMGADVSVDLYGAEPETMAVAVDLIQKLEARFSIYEPNSELSRLNTRGRGRVSVDMGNLLSLCDRLQGLTGGLFDPTVQPVFAALAKGQQPDWDLVGWDKVTWDGAEIRLGKGQSLTLNGIAQGYATDRVRDLLWDRGLRHALVHVGEHAAIGGPFRLGLEDPIAGRVGHRTLENGAIATSSPSQLTFGAHTHILHPLGGTPHWSTVSVAARSAVWADALSTAMCLMPRDKVQNLAKLTQTAVTMIDYSGDVFHLHGT